MADNRDLENLTGNAALDEVTYSSDTALVQLMKPVGVTGSEGSRTVVDIIGTAGSASTGVVTVQGVASGTAIRVSTSTAGTATLANVSGSASSVTLQASNTARLRLDIVNDSTVNLYVKYGSSASTTSYTRLLQAGESMTESLYTGIVTGIWASATGAARMTELTA
jgi:hypothetical protein